MANQEHLDILKQGVATWNTWRQGHLEIQVDLYGANLSKQNLSKANLTGADLNSADLSEADLRGVHLTIAKLRGANLNGAQLIGADLNGADLYAAFLNGTNLSKANFYGVDLRSAHLSGADFSGAYLDSTLFGGVDLSAVKGLETVIQTGPSTISIDTIYRSHGMISDIFLRNAGVPEDFITHIHSLVAQPTEYYTCFISHSSKDRRFCDRLHADLLAKSVQCWYFPEDALWGENVWGEIDRSINVYDKLIVVCSKQSLQSVPVQREIERALNREDRERKNILFPVKIDNYLFDGWEHPRKADILVKVVGDFQEWNSTAKYETALDKLLKALNRRELAQQ